MTTTNKSKKGTVSEMKAAAYFAEQGFYVSKALDPQCPFDLVITNQKGESALIDVKSISKRKTKSYNCNVGTKINRYPSKKQKEMNISIYDQECDS